MKNKSFLSLLFWALFLVAIGSACQTESDIEVDPPLSTTVAINLEATSTSTVIPTATSTLTPTPLPSATPTVAPTDTPSPTATKTPIPTQSVSVSCNEEGKLSFSNLPSVPPFGCVLAVEWWYPRDIAKGCGLWFDVKPISFNEGVDGYWWYITPERVITHTMQYQAKTGNAICKVKDFTR